MFLRREYNRTEQEKQTAKKLIQANAINFNCNAQDVTFVQEMEDIFSKVNGGVKI